MKDKSRAVVISGLNAVAAVGVPLITNVVSPTALSGKEQLFLGLWIFMFLNLLEILFVFSDIRGRVDDAVAVKDWEGRVLEVRDDIDRRISEVQRLLRVLAAGAANNTELFFEYHNRKLHDLEVSLRDACVKREVQIDETMLSVTEWLLQSSFSKGDDCILRAVLPSGETEFFFDIHPRMYFARMLELIRSGQASGVRRLIVVDDISHLEDDRLRRLIRFHNATDRYECRAIMRAHFDRIVLDYKLPHLVVDFGVYAQSYVYKALTNSSNQIVGTYTRDPDEIADFTGCFDTCWKAGYSIQDSEDMLPTSNPSLGWLFGEFIERSGRHAVGS